MNLTKAILCAIGLTLFSQAKADESLEFEAFQKAIQSKYELKEKGFATGDADLLVDNFYAKDAMAVYPDGKIVIGRDNLRPIYEGIVGKSTVKIDSLKPFLDHNSGWDWTNFYVNPNDPDKEPFSFIIIFLWQKIDDEWFVVSYMFVEGEANLS